MKHLELTRTALLGLLAMAAHSGAASASVIAIGPGAFPASTTVINFTGLANGTEVNGLMVGGITFSYSLGNGIVQIDGGPGTTNNIAPPNIVSVGPNTGTLGMLLPGPESMFGYGYAILSGGSVVAATTINLFSGATPVGTLSYNGVPDPTFTGGFAGIQSTALFDRVTVTFNSAAAPAFALDNIRLGNVPEPSALLLTLAGGIYLFCRRLGHAEK